MSDKPEPKDFGEMMTRAIRVLMKIDNLRKDYLAFLNRDKGDQS